MPNPLELAKQALGKIIEEKKRNQELIQSLGPVVIETLEPVLKEIASNSRLFKQELLDAIRGIEIKVPPIDVPKAMVDVQFPEFHIPTPQVNITVPKIEIPDIQVPKSEVTITIPPIEIPELRWPQGDMPITGWVNLMGVDLSHPFPVQLRDSNGNPINLFENLTQVISSGGGISSKIVKVSSLGASSFSEITNSDGRVKVEFTTGSSLEIKQISGAIDSVNVTQMGGNAIVVGSGYQDNAIRVVQATDAVSSVVVNNAFSAIGGAGEANSNALRIIQASDSVSSVSATGNIAHDSPDSGNPVKIGGKASLAAPSAVTSGDRVDSWMDLSGRSAYFLPYTYVNIAGNGTTTAKASPGYLHSLTINTRGTTSVVTLYDNLTDLVNKIATIDTTLSTTAFLYDVYFSSGLVAVTTGGVASDLTISYI